MDSIDGEWYDIWAACEQSGWEDWVLLRDHGTTLPAWKRTRGLPAYCACCGCLKRYCICRCCCGK